MDCFCIITNSEKDKNYETANYIKQYLESQGKVCVLTKDHIDWESGGKHYTNVAEIPEETQCAIVLGGDGTIIQAANDLSAREIPIMGINLGTLGFLAEIEKHNIIPALNHLLQNRCRIENRMMIEGYAICKEEKKKIGYALNDIVINRNGFGHLVSVKVYVNDELIDTYIGDGVIVSTPTGSTGYNLSAGGPILSPELKAMVVSPICPHSLNKRSLVVSAKDTILLKIGQCKEIQKDDAMTILDGRIVNQLETDDIIEIKKAVVHTKIVKLLDTSFFEILRNKLGREKE